MTSTSRQEDTRGCPVKKNPPPRVEKKTPIIEEVPAAFFKHAPPGEEGRV